MSFDQKDIHLDGGFTASVYAHRVTTRPVTLSVEGIVDVRLELDEDQARALAAQLSAAADYAEGR